MEIRLSFDAASHETVEATALAPGRFRLEDTPLLAPEPVYAGDVVEADPRPDGTYRFRRVADAAPMRHYSWVVARAFTESPAFRAYTEAVVAAAGRWEGAFGGLLLVHVPRDSAFDAEGELSRYLAAARPEA